MPTHCVVIFAIGVVCGDDRRLAGPMVTRLIIRHLCDLSPELRRIWAARILVASVVGWLASHVLLVALGQSNFFNHTLNAISWWAIIISSIDVIATSDVKVDTGG